MQPYSAEKEARATNTITHSKKTLVSQNMGEVAEGKSKALTIVVMTGLISGMPLLYSLCGRVRNLEIEVELQG